MLILLDEKCINTAHLPLGREEGNVVLTCSWGAWVHVGMGIVRNLTLLISIVLDKNNISAVELPLQNKKGSRMAPTCGWCAWPIVGTIFLPFLCNENLKQCNTYGCDSTWQKLHYCAVGKGRGEGIPICGEGAWAYVKLGIVSNLTLMVVILLDENCISVAHLSLGRAKGNTVPTCGITKIVTRFRFPILVYLSAAMQCATDRILFWLYKFQMRSGRFFKT